VSLSSTESLAATSLPEIPDKLYFRIGEVAQITGVEPYVLRFWESEFPQLAPKKSGTGRRLFRRKEVETVLEVKRLLYEKRFTIEGARLYLEQNKKKPGSSVKAKATTVAVAVQQGDLFGTASTVDLTPIRAELAAIHKLLSR
jgi:DNA-binding transcriptional MerR regulator